MVDALEEKQAVIGTGFGSWDISSSSLHLDIKAGDYFGLDLLLPIPVQVKYRLVISQPTEYFVSTEIQTSANGKSWVSLSSCYPLCLCFVN